MPISPTLASHRFHEWPCVPSTRRISQPAGWTGGASTSCRRSSCSGPSPHPLSCIRANRTRQKRPHQTDDMWRGSLLLLLLAAATAAEPASTLMGRSHEDRGHAMVLPETGPPVQPWATGVTFNPYYLCICICILALHLG
ncbi:hypothetical protein ACQJBY_018035 [Aegilops geniculata]